MLAARPRETMGQVAFLKQELESHREGTSKRQPAAEEQVEQPLQLLNELETEPASKTQSRKLTS